jgi:hypothetical protein
VTQRPRWDRGQAGAPGARSGLPPHGHGTEVLLGLGGGVQPGRGVRAVPAPAVRAEPRPPAPC